MRNISRYLLVRNKIDDFDYGFDDVTRESNLVINHTASENFGHCCKLSEIKVKKLK